MKKTTETIYKKYDKDGNILEHTETIVKEETEELMPYQHGVSTKPVHTYIPYTHWPSDADKDDTLYYNRKNIAQVY